MFHFETNIDRSGLFDKFSKEDIVARYKRNYGLNEVSFEQVKCHAELEGKLTDRILSSTSAERAKITADAYSTLYNEINWLTTAGGEPEGRRWLSLLRQNADVYEVGSGAGRLANYLNLHGIRCIRTDISSERNSANNEGDVQITDGVSLTAFTREKYDFVISDQVVEHIHPADILVHFTEARMILRNGGSYIFRAPNAHCGPQDLSSVFGEKRAVFMHLHEFTWRDVPVIVNQCGYIRAKAVVKLPKWERAFASSLYFSYLKFAEGLIERVPHLRRFAKYFFFPSQVWVVLNTD